MEEELNELVHEKAKNDAIAKAAFDQRVKDAKRQAIEENVKKAQKNNSLLTQTIDDNDNLPDAPTDGDDPIEENDDEAPASKPDDSAENPVDELNELENKNAAE